MKKNINNLTTENQNYEVVQPSSTYEPVFNTDWTEQIVKNAQDIAYLAENKIIRYKGTVPTFADLPSTANIGDWYYVVDEQKNYIVTAINPIVWTPFEPIDLTNYYTKPQVDALLLTKVNASTYEIDKINFESEITDLQNTKADITYVDSQDFLLQQNLNVVEQNSIARDNNLDTKFTTITNGQQVQIDSKVGTAEFNQSQGIQDGQITTLDNQVQAIIQSIESNTESYTYGEKTTGFPAPGVATNQPVAVKTYNTTREKGSFSFSTLNDYVMVLRNSSTEPRSITINGNWKASHTNNSDTTVTVRLNTTLLDNTNPPIFNQNLLTSTQVLYGSNGETFQWFINGQIQIPANTTMNIYFDISTSAGNVSLSYANFLIQGTGTGGNLTTINDEFVLTNGFSSYNNQQSLNQYIWATLPDKASLTGTNNFTGINSFSQNVNVDGNLNIGALNSGIEFITDTSSPIELKSFGNNLKVTDRRSNLDWTVYKTLTLSSIEQEINYVATPTLAHQASPKSYVDNKFNIKTKSTNGSDTGTLSMTFDSDFISNKKQIKEFYIKVDNPGAAGPYILQPTNTLSYNSDIYQWYAFATGASTSRNVLIRIRYNTSTRVLTVNAENGITFGYFEISVDYWPNVK